NRFFDGGILLALIVFFTGLLCQIAVAQSSLKLRMLLLEALHRELEVPVGTRAVVLIELRHCHVRLTPDALSVLAVARSLRTGHQVLLELRAVQPAARVAAVRTRSSELGAAVRRPQIRVAAVQLELTDSLRAAVARDDLELALVHTAAHTFAKLNNH
uniref:Secreted protein n=1 Tax=Macrostomum lignano TaxID=282301 RepID=A0A1I8HB38_9PLAT